ncbi:MAG TPA: alpha-ketoglutarate-dependent dioxygenase AlkB, partial [Acidimicrobiales bacterium]|nr:alpha-ketoglutarate-dependent dioxygenase AlkB [Acidimicrobiales bacterium]
LMLAFQGSLLSEPTPAVTNTPVARRRLAKGAWVDHAPGWLAGADALFEQLSEELPWRQGNRWMYERRVDDPRLTTGLDPEAWAAYPIFDDITAFLGRRYGGEFRSCWLNLYRDGRDSVAWHGDRVAREKLTALVAIVSVGERRPFRLRPKGGGPSIGYELGRGDLLVMGGTCQRTWDHGVPKVAKAGPRMSLTFRPAGQEIPEEKVSRRGS